VKRPKSQLELYLSTRKLTPSYAKVRIVPDKTKYSRKNKHKYNVGE